MAEKTETKNKMTLLAGFMPLLCMCAMLSLNYIPFDDKRVWIVALFQTAPFLIPSFIIALYGAVSKKPVSLRLNAPPKKSFGFIVSISVSASLLSLLINCAVAALTGSSYYKTVSYSSEIGGSTALALLLMVVLPAVFEEFFFRGVLLSALSSGGTGAAIFVSAICFALCHGDVHNLAGPFAAGLIFGYIAYALDSVWPAVAAHLINNGISLLIAHVTRAYELLGLWSYFLIITAALFLVFTVLSMNALEKLIQNGKIKRLIRAPSRAAAAETLLTPGLFVLIALFIIHIITEA